MNYFAVLYTYATDKAKLDKVRPEHRRYLSSLAENVGAGPLLDTDPGRALLLFQAESLEAVTQLLDADPFHAAGLIANREVFGWNPATGSLAQ
ncbi:YciI family protein [uncultured Tessaracoccus sp.]|uniref:YciI family protein n=1 Tax=uncultured Tessaracoccus sp. TaxID=905023 RepID=UPI00262A2314|nr:YciI family protein [uncultured Tessaracoccus sp.]